MSHSSATITALAAFENGRRADGNALIFDAQIYLGDGKPPLLAALRYFNKELRVLNDIGFFLIIARVAKIELGVHIALQPATGVLENDYDLVGDVVIQVLTTLLACSPSMHTNQKPHGSQSATMERFCVEIESIVYLRPPMVSSSASISATPASPTVGNPW
ncbi:hypothetical protein EDD15DRAFT_2203121 [Pisolithus albus]|nr:hypothetical protein EDD15DRAFT_2203121 [Pisolithus albus]